MNVQAEKKHMEAQEGELLCLCRSDVPSLPPLGDCLGVVGSSAMHLPTSKGEELMQKSYTFINSVTLQHCSSSIIYFSQWNMSLFTVVILTAMAVCFTGNI